MRDKRGFGIVVAVARVPGTGRGGEVSRLSFSPGVAELLPHAVRLREVAAIGAASATQICAAGHA